MNLIDAVRRDLASDGMRLRNAGPRGNGRLVMDILRDDGQVCAGQWHADTGETARVARDLRKRFGRGTAHVLSRGHLVVQLNGADRKLSGLHDLVCRPGAVLVGHRAERRAVVRLDPERYTKVVRPENVAHVVVPLREVRPAELRVPRVLDADHTAGMVTVSTVHGRTLHDRLADQRLSDEELATDAKQVGAALRALHGLRASVPRRVHDGEAETAAALHWLEAADRYGLLPSPAWRRRVEQLRTMLHDSPPELALLHRDLHDKQLVLEHGEPVGLLDLDLAAYGDPALDLANLLVHLDLRARQGLCSPRRAQVCSVALLEGYCPHPGLLPRLRGYAVSTRLRLAGVYSFRHSPDGLVEYLLDPGHDPGYHPGDHQLSNHLNQYKEVQP